MTGKPLNLTPAEQQQLTQLRESRAQLKSQYGANFPTTEQDNQIRSLEIKGGATPTPPSPNRRPRTQRTPAASTRRTQPVTATQRTAPPSPGSAPPAAAIAAESTQTGTHISPYIASTESLHPFIQYELIKRTKASEMATIYMPFVKLTSLSNVLGDNLSQGEKCSLSDVAFPSLGIHGKTEVAFDDIYTPIGERSIVGYATGLVNKYVPTEGLGETAVPSFGRVPILVSNEDAVNDPPNIPMPGIVGMTTERGTAGAMGVRGGLFKATIKIKAYSTGQVNVLLRYFLRPATRVILELGHRSATNIEDKIQSQNNEYYQKFDWDRDPLVIDEELKPLVTLEKGQREFIQKYIYNNFGNYEIFIGYVVDFKLKYNKDNTYEIDLIIHSLQQYEVPLSNTGVQSINGGSSVPDPCKTVEIKDYFRVDAGHRENSFVQVIKDATTKGLTDSVRLPIDGDTWTDHVISLRGPGASPGAGGNDNPAYLVSWQFFVDVILNDLKYGVLSVFQQTPESDTMKYLRSSVLRAIGKTRSTDPNSAGTLGYNDGEFFDNPLVSLESNEVGWSASLRSTDPSVMVIYNPAAQNNSVEEDAREIAAKLSRLGVVSDEEATAIAQGFQNESVVKTALTKSSIGGFVERKKKVPIPTGGGNFTMLEVPTKTSVLTKGVWLNTNAIIQAFEGTDVLSVAINNLLTMMNNATRGFWNLQLLSNDTESPGLHVIDMGLSKPVNFPETLDSLRVFENNILNTEESSLTIDTDVKKLGTYIESKIPNTVGVWKPNYLYVFNRAVQSIAGHDTGGELLDISLESSLPQVIAVQAIAGVGGQMQRGTLEAIDIGELKKITRYNVYPACSNNAKISCGDPNSLNTVKRPSELPEAVGNQIKNLLKDGAPPQLDTQAELTKSVDAYIKRGICPDPPPGVEVSAQQKKKCEEESAKIKAAADAYTGALRAVLRQQAEANKPGYLDMVGKYAGKMGAVLDFIEWNLTQMAKNQDEESQQKEVHPFNSSNLTKTLVDLTMPGIGGIQMFQAFAVARTPNIVSKGYYVVTKVAHEFSTDSGWTTKIQGRFRYNPKFAPTNAPPPKRCGDNTTCPDAPAGGTQ